MLLDAVRRGLLGLCLCGALALTPASPAEAGLSRAQAYARAAALEALGRKMFADPALSGSGRMACTSCHDPARAFGPANDLSVQRGGKDMRTLGFRAAPSLRYPQAVPQFTEHYYESEDEGDASIDNGPTGGLTWDGRADRGRDQARFPLLSPFEMANDSEAAVAAHRSFRPRRILRAVPHTVPAQCGATQSVLSQWRDSQPAPGHRVLCRARYQAREMVPARREVRRSTGAVSRQYQPGGAIRRQAGRAAGPDGGGNRRHRRVSQHPDRRLYPGALKARHGNTARISLSGSDNGRSFVLS